MADTAPEIPHRAWFKPSEVCEITQVQSYVLRSWESEFPGLGVARPGGPGRMYRRSDVEQVLLIKQLVFQEGLTLAGVRRRMEGELAQPVGLAYEEPLPEAVRVRVAAVKQGLRSLLDVLSTPPGAGPIEVENGRLPAAALEASPAAAGTDAVAPGRSADEEAAGGSAQLPILLNGAPVGEGVPAEPAPPRKRRVGAGRKRPRPESPPNG